MNKVMKMKVNNRMMEQIKVKFKNKFQFKRIMKYLSIKRKTYLEKSRLG